MLATDPLSLVFLGCFVFSGVFLIISTVSGMGHAHLGHVGHVGHVGSVSHAGHIGHVGHASVNGHAAGHAVDTGHAAPQTNFNPFASIGQFLVGGINVFSILTFLFFFGLLGYLFHNFVHLFAFLSVFIAAALGIAAGLGVSVVLARLFAAQSGVVTYEDSRLEGRLGKVSLAIRSDGVGEVIYLRQGAGRQSIGARGLDGEPLDVDTEVVIIGIHDGIADVQSWDAFMRRARAGNAPTLETLETIGPAT